LLGAGIAFLGAFGAQWFRSLLDRNRERESMRQVLMLEVSVVGTFLEHIEKFAASWSLPPGNYFWQQVDNAMMGFDTLRAKLPLLPRVPRIAVTAYFLKAKGIRLLAESIANNYASDSEGRGETRRANHEMSFSRLRAEARAERLYALDVFKALYVSVPVRWWLRWGADTDQKHRSLGAAEEEAERLGLHSREIESDATSASTVSASGVEPRRKEEAGMDQKSDNQIKLYGLLVDQLTKYNAIFWQAPAVVGANFVALTNRTALGPPTLLALVIFNCAMLYAFARMVVRQSEITWATEDAERELRKAYQCFVPSFAPSGMSSRLVLVVAMTWLNGWLLVCVIHQLFQGVPTGWHVVIIASTVAVVGWLSAWLWRATRRSAHRAPEHTG